jgi:IS5 family transposase
MRQFSFSNLEFGAKRKLTRREKCLSEMDQVIPWAGLIKLIEPVYHKGKQGRSTHVKRWDLESRQTF